LFALFIEHLKKYMIFHYIIFLLTKIVCVLGYVRDDYTTSTKGNEAFERKAIFRVEITTYWNYF